MKAIVQDTYGGPEVLELRDIHQPVPRDDEVLVRAHAAGPDRGVWHVMTGLPGRKVVVRRSIDFRAVPLARGRVFRGRAGDIPDQRRRLQSRI